MEEKSKASKPRKGLKSYITEKYKTPTRNLYSERTRGTNEQGQRAYEYQQEIQREHEERMKYIEEQLSDNRGRMNRD